MSEGFSLKREKLRKYVQKNVSGCEQSFLLFLACHQRGRINVFDPFDKN